MFVDILVWFLLTWASAECAPVEAEFHEGKYQLMLRGKKALMKLHVETEVFFSLSLKCDLFCSVSEDMRRKC